jgi:4a-hydroxytetrahydrobiopterin dehydratase
MDLSKKRCKPCEGGIAPLDQQEVEGYLKQIKDGWKITDNNKISKEFLFVNFKHTMDFVNKQIFTIPFKIQLQLLSVPGT